VAVGNQRGSALQSWRGGWARARIEVFRPLPARLAITHLDGADDEDFPGIARIEERTAFVEEDFRLIDFDNSFQWFAVRINHRSPQLLRQNQAVL
jgi:hypothetical protein